MALADSLKALREVNLSELTLDNIGTWPFAVKLIVWVLVFGLVCFLGYNYHLKGLREQYDATRQTETQLREEFRQAAADPDFLRDVDEVMADFAAADGETARMIR